MQTSHETKYITNARIFTGETTYTNRAIAVQDGRITALLSIDAIPAGANTIDLHGDCIAPGFIDIQINGGYQRYFSLQPDEETVREITQACLEHATPYFYITLISSPVEVIHQAIVTIREAKKHNPHLLGMHLEGPFLNPIRKGAHSESVIRSVDGNKLKEILDAGKDVIRLITVAPECLLPEQMEYLSASGIQVSIGHSNLDYETAMRFFDEGVNMVTHLYNAMSPFTHRAPGLVGATLEAENVYAPIILDGRHCHPASARLAYRCKKEKLILLTDAAVLGRRMKEMNWEGLHAMLTPDGYYVNPDGNLAGSAISMPEAVRNAQHFLGVSLQEAVEMATSRVAKAIGQDKYIGYIATGYPTVFSVFDESLTKYRTLML